MRHSILGVGASIAAMSLLGAASASEGRRYYPMSRDSKKSSVKKPRKFKGSKAAKKAGRK